VQQFSTVSRQGTNIAAPVLTKFRFRNMAIAENRIKARKGEASSLKPARCHEVEY
jgi:hypothetical protein